METIIGYTFGTLVIIIMALGVYIQSVMISEEKQGKRIPLFWEKE